jgi:anti-sigma factor RsiW
LDTLRRAAEHGYPWSIYPAEATALVAEVERLRAEVAALREQLNDYADAAFEAELRETDEGRE